MPRGELFLISAPSGAGKTTLMEMLLDGPLGRSGSLATVVSHTTRPPRHGERPGVDYHFVNPEKFERLVAADQFLEWAHVHGHRYGTSREEVVPRLAAGFDVLHDLDVQGAERLLARMPEAHTIFVLPPSFAALRSRLLGRGADEPAAIARRLDVSLWEIERYSRYDYVIVNDNAERAGAALAAIITEKRQRMVRAREQAEAIVAEIRREIAALSGSSGD